MNQRLLVLGLVVLVGLAGCSSLFGDDAGTGAETESPDATATDRYVNPPPGVTADGTLRDPEALIEAHTEVLERTGYATSTTVRVEPRAPGGDSEVTEYRALVERGRTPFWIEINTSIGGRLTSHQTVWGNDSVRYRRVGLPGIEGDSASDYDRESRGPPSVDPGIRALDEFLVAGEFRVVEDSGERIRLVADELRGGRFGGTGVDAHSYSGELVVDDRNRIRRVDIRMGYTTARGQSQVATVEYGIDREGGVDTPTPDWIGTAIREARDVAIDVGTVGDDGIVITSVGSEPIPVDARFVVATGGRVVTLGVEEAIPPGETVYVFDPVGGGVQLSRDEPGVDRTGFRGTYRVILRGPDDEELATVDVEFD
jgi:hypothetical protein